MRVALLCNDRLAFPALDHLIHSGALVAVGMPARTNETQLMVRERCQLAGLPFQAFNKVNLENDLVQWLNLHQPDVVLVKTFPFLIPAKALQIPPHGFINFHYAPLPHWRGPNPLFWMIRTGAKTGGVTVHQMNESFDAGPILLEQKIPIDNSINFGILYTQLSFVGLKLTIDLLNQLKQGTLNKMEQDHQEAGWYRHPKPAELFINWNTMDAEEIKSLIKACNPWHKGAATRWNGWTFGITYASVTEDSTLNDARPGSILSIDTNMGFTIACKDGKALLAEVVYCEEGFYPGYCLSAFGLQAKDQLS